MIYDDPNYARFLEDRLDEIKKILARLLWIREKNDVEAMNALFGQVEEWIGSDWWISLPNHEQEEFVSKHCSE